MRYLALLSIVVLFVSLAHAGNYVDDYPSPTVGESYMKALHSGRFDTPSGTAPPSADCDADSEAGRLYFDTDAPSGQRLYGCEGTAGWKLQGDGGAGGGAKYVYFGSEVTGRTATFWIQPGGAGGTTEASVNQLVAPETCTASKLYAEVATAPGAGNSWTVSVNVNGTALTEPSCQISGTATSCSETTSTGTVTVNQSLNVEFLEGGTATSTGGASFSFICTP